MTSTLPRRSIRAYFWVAPVTLVSLFFALIIYWLGASAKWRLGVLEVAGNTRTPILRALSNWTYPALTDSLEILDLGCILH
jgi:hypothetical protein